jgi:hypothetical protein
VGPRASLDDVDKILGPTGTRTQPLVRPARSGSLSLSMALQPFRPWPLFQFLNPYTIGRTPLTGDQPVAPAHRTTQTE